MGQKLNQRVDIWKKRLLDFGKSNKLINIKEAKRSCIRITSPSVEEIFRHFVLDEEELKFPYARKFGIDEEGEDLLLGEVRGDIETNLTISNLQKALKAIRSKAKTISEERGVNTLYITLGSITWTETDTSDVKLTSPLVLVPAKLQIESLTSPYTLTLGEDEIVVNPTLVHKFNHDFGISLPESCGEDIVAYFGKVSEIIKGKGWTVNEDIFLALLSFLKINMYNDLQNNLEKMGSCQVLAAIAGEEVISIDHSDIDNYDYDKNIKPIEVFQVVDADSSQQDAIRLSKTGVSFVLQGPPGTGKSQTITNIISEALADGKKILFVSEKMAALQVVYNRLEEAGLADFCLTLHNYKANKKEILNNLAKCISADKTQVQQSAIDQLAKLERDRNALNEYQEQLHTPWSALNCSIFMINGEIAKLESAPDVIFHIQNPESISLGELNAREAILVELSQTIGKRTEDYDANVWRGSSVERLTNELRHDIDSQVAYLVPRIKEVVSIYYDCVEHLKLALPSNLDSVSKLLDILAIAKESPLFIPKWKEADLDALISQCRHFSEMHDRLSSLTSAIDSNYNTKIWQVDAEKCKEEISSSLTALRASINLPSEIDIKEIKEYINRLDALKERISLIMNLAEEISNSLPSLVRNISFDSVCHVTRLATVINTCAVIPASWCDRDELTSAAQMIDTAEQLHHNVQQARQEILARFDKEIFDIDFYSILKRFRTNYTSGIKRLLGSEYKLDLSSIKQYLKDAGKFGYSEALDILNKLKTLADKQEMLNSRSSLYSTAYGELYNDFNTDWNQIRRILNSFQSIYQIFPNSVLPTDLIACISDKKLPIELLTKLLNTYDSSILQEINKFAINQFEEDSLIDAAKIFVEKTLSNLLILLRAYDEFSEHRKVFASFSTVMSELNDIAVAQSIHRTIITERNTLKNDYEDYYDGASTDWVTLEKSLHYVKKLCSFEPASVLTPDFVDFIAKNPAATQFCTERESSLRSAVSTMKPCLEWFFDLFVSADSFKSMSLDDLAARITECRDKKHQLEEWVDFCSIRKRCVEMGMSEFVDQVEATHIEASQIIGAYKKRFYRLWLDQALEQFPAVRNFRERIHSQTIVNFRTEDTFQFKIAQARIRERLYRAMPNCYSMTSANDETAILRRELNKSRRLMPLRKLFREIPNLLTALKPCFMMSPLSVSVFLEAKSYMFDLVIFDEASQVHTEDAVGAIMRGKQTIIVGDTKQLPPTNFFSSTLEDNNDDFDSENEEIVDTASYQSILDEASTVLPDRSLRWHYRSRHEDLIAFSNIKIYHNSLITFPSSEERKSGVGVEYVYVEDGVYDRGKGAKHNNIIEAKKVADLVFEHFRTYPERSLGVVAFSESQQEAIENALYQKRHLDPSYENYFNESAKEPFFIKNLETVQGDERDTIIFSIGYAKDRRGIITMNFGPLNGEGGYRRLNVAITRAKYNVKLVGSIQPSDIDLDRTSAEGVKMLRSYIEFAQQGIAALEKEITYNKFQYFDSPFEESVYIFLTSKGYDVATQIGCSGFRIDMGVKDPRRKGHFAIGIECDGATYHSARTARERDRLRQEVLEKMGWRIYRVWSTDWIKNPAAEKQKLIDAVEDAIVNNPSRSYAVSEDSSTPVLEAKVTPIEGDSSEKTDSFLTTNTYAFDHYERVDLSAVYRRCGGNEVNIIRNIIEFEQPIHIKDLCGIVAPIYDNQKVTSKIIGNVRHVLNSQLRSEITETDNFISMKTLSAVRVRVPRKNDIYIRPIEFISKLELWAAMSHIISNTFGITAENLLTTTAREFGFKRTGGNISRILRSAYSEMLSSGVLEEVDGKPVLTAVAKNKF